MTDLGQQIKPGSVSAIRNELRNTHSYVGDCRIPDRNSE
jgi:hypothetical protein